MPGERKYDIIVVGAGITGMSSAYHLRKNNPTKSVLVVDRFAAVGQGNTGRSNAMFRNTFSSVDNQVLADTSINFYLHAQRELGSDIGMELLGYLWLMSERQLKENERYVESMIRNRIEVRRYGRGDLEHLIPGMVTTFDRSNGEAEVLRLEGIEGALFGVKCGQLDADKLTGFYRDQFVGLGGTIAYLTNVERLLVEPDEKLDLPGEPFVWQDTRVSGVRVGGNLQGELEAETVVMAAGAWNNELLEPRGLDGHVKAKKRQMFKVPAKTNAALSRLLHNGNFNSVGAPPMIILPKSGVHFKPVKVAGEFWVGCEDEVNQPYINVPERDPSSYSAEAAFYEQNIYPVLKEYFPMFQNVRPAQMWAGLYAYNTLDYLPFVSPGPGLILVGGDSGSGIMKGDAIGRVVDAVYKSGKEAEALLYGDVPFRASKLGFEGRNVQREEWLL